MNEEAPERRHSSAERHAQTLLTLTAVGLLGWQLYTTSQLDNKVGILNNDMVHFKTELYRAVALPNTRIDDLNRRIEIMEVHVLQEMTDLLKEK